MCVFKIKKGITGARLFVIAKCILYAVFFFPFCHISFLLLLPFPPLHHLFTFSFVTSIMEPFPITFSTRSSSTRRKLRNCSQVRDCCKTCEHTNLTCVACFLYFRVFVFPFCKHCLQASPLLPFIVQDKYVKWKLISPN